MLGPKFCIKLVAQYYSRRYKGISIDYKHKREGKTHEEDESTDGVLLEFVISESHTAQEDSEEDRALVVKIQCQICWLNRCLDLPELRRE